MFYAIIIPKYNRLMSLQIVMTHCGTFYFYAFNEIPPEYRCCMKLPVCSYFLIIILVVAECYERKRKTGSVDYENGILGRGPCKLWCGSVIGPGGLKGGD